MSDATWTRFLDTALLGEPQHVGNVRSTVHTVSLAGERVPLVHNTARRADVSWIASLRNTFGLYARAEARAAPLPRLGRWSGIAASHLAESLLTAAGFSGGCYLDSWLISTDLHPARLDGAAVQSAVDAARRIAPHEPVVLRSLTPPLHGRLLTELAKAGFELLPTRQVWLVTDPANGQWRRRRDAANDLRLAAQSTSRWIHVNGREFSAADFAAAHALYQQLYRSHYPPHNPNYTEDFLRMGVASGFLELTGWRSTESGTLQAFIGMIERDGVSATPLLGYDLAAPRELGLYRLASLRVWEHAESRGTLLHCSAGAGGFKASRGAESFVEFAAVWTRHLARSRRAAFAGFAGALRRWAVPYLESHRV